MSDVGSIQSWFIRAEKGYIDKSLVSQKVVAWHEDLGCSTVSLADFTFLTQACLSEETWIFWAAWEIIGALTTAGTFAKDLFNKEAQHIMNHRPRPPKVKVSLFLP